MKRTSLFLASVFSFAAFAGGPINTVEDYDQQLPVWGTSWAPGSGSDSGYYPSFYTGFAMRSEFPQRIHVRLSRGNQTRVSVILDEQTLQDYLFDLKARYDFYKKVTASKVNVNPSGGKFLPQLSYFEQVIESPVYGILPYVEKAAAGGYSQEAIHAKALEVLSALNPGRVFEISLDLNAEFGKWRKRIQAKGQVSNEADVIEAIDSLVWGRINYAQKPTEEVLQKLSAAVGLALNGSDADFNAAAFELFKAVTGDKYAIKTLDANGRFQDAVVCGGLACTLDYYEFTTIYPTGSVRSQTSDQYGNSIASFATPGLWQFIDHGGTRGVDNIRKEGYYGWIPKMDYQAAGNGFHNVAVRFAGASSDSKKVLGMDPSHTTIWTVMRGGVSHGCSRLPSGHIWEMRHIFPVENSKMSQIHHFGHLPQDFDLYDIDGNGTLEVMGVEYLISYGLKSTDGLGSREGSDLSIDTGKKLSFYNKLYGSKNVFTAEGQSFTFINPTVSLPSYLDDHKTQVKSRVTFTGQFPLYEMAYPKDKIQFYAQAGTKVAKLMGRVRGCAPSSDKNSCGEAAFKADVKATLGNF